MANPALFPPQVSVALRNRTVEKEIALTVFYRTYVNVQNI